MVSDNGDDSPYSQFVGMTVRVDWQDAFVITAARQDEPELLSSEDIPTLHSWGKLVRIISGYLVLATRWPAREDSIFDRVCDLALIPLGCVQEIHSLE